MKYIDIDSTYRDRELYPLSSNFTFNNTYVPWLEFVHKFGGKDQNLTDLTFSGTQTHLILNELDVPDNSIVGLELKCGTQSSMITEWDNQLKSLTISQPFTDLKNTCDIVDETRNNVVFCPDKLIIGSGLLLLDINTDEYRTIIDYKNGFLHLDKPFSNLWEITHNYEIITQKYDRSGVIDLANETINNLREGQWIRLRDINNPSNVIPTIAVTKGLGFFPRLPTEGIFRYSVLKQNRFYSINRTTTSCSNKIYNISINNIVLPNTLLDHPEGKVTTNIPFVYVVFCNDTKYNTFETNNPNMINAVFKCPMTDISNVNESSFVKITSPMVHKMLFDLNSEIKFSVHLPDGSLLKFKQQDTNYPDSPLYNLQISACFELDCN